MKKIIRKNGKLLEAVKKVPEIAKHEAWIFTFDREEGSFFYSLKIISDNANLHQITDEYALYLDEKGKPEGIMIENYEVNFLKHYKDLKKLSSVLFSGKKKVEEISPLKKNFKNMPILKSLFEKTLLKEANKGFIGQDF